MARKIYFKRSEELHGKPVIEGHWVLNTLLSDEEAFKGIVDKTFFGFIYKVTFLLTGQRYLGKKALWRTTKAGKVLGVSNWRSYKSSSPVLEELRKQYPPECFLYEIILLCPTRGFMSYAESNLIHKANILTSVDPYGDPLWLNRRAEEVQWRTKDYSLKFIHQTIREKVLKNAWEIPEEA